jgi:GT2 family glycosyltransferase
MAKDPAISVVVPSHARRLRLRWLLNALEEQTLPRERWEAIVVHDYDDEDTQAVVERHPLFAEGTLRQIRIESGTGSPARQRNLGWRDARAPLVAFTDDDCRPERDWLEKLLEGGERYPGAIVQGATRPDPLELEVYAAPHARSLHVDPPGPFAQTCNILYPTRVLESANGFDESFPGAAGEDLDLALRARKAGTPYEGAPDALVYHAVEAYPLPKALRLSRKWGAIPYLVKLHPELREDFPLRVFWRDSHYRLALGLAGLTAATRFKPAALLALPYVVAQVNRRGKRKSSRLACTLELPGRVVVDSAELTTLIRGSVRYGTLVL